MKSVSNSSAKLYPSDKPPAAFGWRIAAITLLLALLAYWIWFSGAMVSLALDYPLRRAGESAEFPARDSPAFFWNCVYQTGRLLLVTSLAWLIPAGMVFGLTRYVFPRLRGWRYWLSGLAYVALPVIGQMCYGMFGV